MTKKTLHIEKAKALALNTRDILKSGHPDDAQLMSCLLFAIVAACDGGFVSYERIAKAYNVTEWTVGRWIEGLEERGLLKLTSGGVGIVVAEVIVKDTKKAEALAKEPVIENYEKGMNVVQQSRYSEALRVLYTCDNIVNRALTHGKAKMLTTLASIVKADTFKHVDLPRELRDADAWLIQSRKGYTDMGRYVTNWMRNAAKKKIVKNANAPTAGKYDKLQAKAKGKKLWPD